MAFQHAFRTRCIDGSSPIPGGLVLKKNKEHAKQNINETQDLSIENHTRKQVQMHSIARNLAHRFALKVPEQFGKSFIYGKAFYAFIDGKPTLLSSLSKVTFSSILITMMNFMTCLVMRQNTTRFSRMLGALHILLMDFPKS